MADVIDETLHALTGATEDILYDAVHLLSVRSASNDDMQLISLWARMWRHGKRNVHGNAHVHKSSVTVSGPSVDGAGAAISLGNWTVSRLTISARTWPYACEMRNPSKRRSSVVALAMTVDLLIWWIMVVWARSPRKTRSTCSKTFTEECVK